MRTTLLLFAISVCASAARTNDYKLEDKSPVSHSFSGDTKLDVDTVSGSIDVVGDGGSVIRVEGERVIRARDQEAMNLAKKEVVLDINEKNGTAQLYANGPFRSNNGRNDSEGHGFHEHPERAYEVSYNLVVHVPAKMDLRLYSVNGHLSAKRVQGRFDLHTINGAVEMDEIAGAGKAYALNGGTRVQFRENPTGECNLQSFNGKLEVVFPASLNANLKFKTFNGAVYTDFEGTTLPMVTPAAAENVKQENARQRDGRFVFRSKDSYQAMKIGAGGPEIQLETFNGSIQIRKGK